jgi:hypothetical protein
MNSISIENARGFLVWLFMALTFKGTSIPGIHGDLIAPSPEVQRTETATSGLRGISELRGELNGGEFVVNVTLFNGYSNAAAVYSAIATLRNLQGKNGALVESGNRSFSESNVTLVDVALNRGPMPCNGASTVGTFTGWMAELQLRFRRLRP